MPQIKLTKSVIVKKINSNQDSLVLVTFSYTDGDGDIGLSETDTASPFKFGQLYFHNLHVAYFVNNGSGYFKQVNPFSPSNDTIHFNERIENITPSGKNKAIEGEFTLIIPANPFDIKPKDVKFEIELIDRALNISNKLVTGSLLINP